MAGEIDEVDGRLRSFALRWGPIYKKVSDWISERLSVMNATSCAFETKMCFFIYGWVPSRQVSSLRNGLDEKFSGTVVVEEKEIREEDLDRIPVMLRNPAYFRPFELFTRLLPLPRYTSYDPTPFVAIFFPVFFGMILGDAGYGVILLALSLILVRRFRKKKNVADAGKILFASSLYAVFFGILYGELFGGLGHALIGLKPICIERRTAVIPMIVFSLSIGAVHVFIGFLLGIISAIRKKMKREAASRILSMVAVICLLGVIGSFFGLFPEIFTTPLLLVLLGLSPLVLLTGGILAPLEILKSIGNIISYVRIMAIGLTSVLLAFIANRLGGMTGDIMLGAVVAGLLHLLNIILGVFSPTIHSLRLHYVEFFGKFIESGGKSFEPMKKAG